jgi:cyclic-di-AMP phosphodiesterase PgpH
MIASKANYRLLVLEAVCALTLLLVVFFFSVQSSITLFRLGVFLLLLIVVSQLLISSTVLSLRQTIIIYCWFLLSVLFMFTTNIYLLMLPIAIGTTLMPSTLLLHLSILILPALPGDLVFFLQQIILVLVFVLGIKKLYRLTDFLYFVVLLGFIYFMLHVTSITDIALNLSLLKESINVSMICFLVYLIGQFLVGGFGYSGSRFILYELLNPEHPLMKTLAFKAPGTYQHSINVGTLAIEVGKAIGNVDLLLLKSGAMIHDIGKMESPEYFTENQTENTDRYLEKNIDQSTNIILNHVSNGLRLAKKYRLPFSLQEVITGHHGTSLTAFYYRKKQKTEDISEEKFRYPGPKPVSRESGIIMLADSIEAAARSKLDTIDKPEEFNEKAQKLIDQIFEQKLNDEQLTECSLSTRELALMKETFLYTLKMLFHTRVKYQKEE